MRTSFVVQYFCTHVCVWTYSRVPIVGDEGLCARCGTVQPILTLDAEYRVACRGSPGSKCRYGRGFGAGLLSAQYAADRHAKKFPSHTIHVRRGVETVEIRFPNRNQTVMEFGSNGVDNEPPF